MATYSGTPFPTVQAGDNATVAIKPDGTLESWGSGPLVPAPALSGVASITAHDDWGLAVHSDGTVSFMGTEPLNSGVSSIPAGLSGVVHVDSGLYHAIATHSDGTVTGWGTNYQGALDIPAGLSNVKMVAAGSQYCIALKNDGTLVEWGSPAQPAPAITNVSYISANSATTVALLNDGTVQAWGSNSLGQTDVPVGLSGVSRAESSGTASIAVLSDGTYEVWGSTANAPSGISNAYAVISGWEARGLILADGSLNMWAFNMSRAEIQVPAGFEAMLPGDAPAATDFIDATIPFSAEINLLDGPIASFDATIPFGSEVRAYQDWTSNLDPRELQTVYLLRITGDQNGLPDLEIPISSWQGTSQAGGRRSYLQAVVPAATDLVEPIEARVDGNLVILKGYRFSDGSLRTEEILRSNFDTPRSDRGPGSFSMTLSGYLSGKVAANDQRSLQGIRSISIANGKRRVRCAIDFFLQPGMTVTAEGGTFTADYINYFVNRNDEFCEVSER